jgi:hypothetical protein
MVVYSDKKLDAKAEVFGKALRQMLADGSAEQNLSTYVNYAYGDESLEELYGFDAWRLEKLRKLKGLYDPENRFRFYAPIPPEKST